MNARRFTSSKPVAAIVSRIQEHPWIALLSAANLALLVTDYIFQIANGMFTPLRLIVFLIECVLVMGLNIMPRISAIAFLIIDSVIVLVPPSFSSVNLISALTCTGIIGFLSPPIGLACTSLMLTVQLLESQIHGQKSLFPSSSVIFAFILYLGAYSAGFLAHMRRIAVENKRLQHDALLARRLHDTVTNGLSRIALLSTNMDDSRLEIDTHTALSQIHAQALESLRQARQIITNLEQTPNSGMEFTDHIPEQQFTDMIAQENCLLIEQGFHATILVCEHPFLNVNDSTHALLFGLVKELLTNIRKYADPEQECLFTIANDGHLWSIQLADTPKHPSSVPELSGKTGLRYYRQSIINLGGQWCQQTDKQWTLRASITLPIAMPANRRRRAVCHTCGTTVRFFSKPAANDGNCAYPVK